ncbi:helix-turn-helix domain-containing protein [Rhodococcus sp. NPDC006774]|uniref:helix-turn-helix domain-containing protein n=1 Tax=Rhodococcus sp. NPDC006774 TaxID=3157186 RepID=UPI003407B47C
MPKGCKFLGLTMATFAGTDGENIRPSVRRLALEMEVSERTVIRALGWLREEEWIAKTRQGNRWLGKTNEYRLVLPPGVLERLHLDPDGEPISDGKVVPIRPSLSDTHVTQTGSESRKSK